MEVIPVYLKTLMERNCQVAEEEEDDLHEQEEDIFGDDEDNPIAVSGKNCQNTQFCRIKGCGGAGCPSPPMIFERLKLPQQIIYRRKGNLSESPNHFKYRENILISRFYEQFSRSSRNLGHFWKFEKISNS